MAPRVGSAQVFHAMFVCVSRHSEVFRYENMEPAMVQCYILLFFEYSFLLLFFVLAKENKSLPDTAAKPPSTILKSLFSFLQVK